jgi:hypothetical protein
VLTERSIALVATDVRCERSTPTAGDPHPRRYLGQEQRGTSASDDPLGVAAVIRMVARIGHQSWMTPSCLRWVQRTGIRGGPRHPVTADPVGFGASPPAVGGVPGVVVSPGPTQDFGAGGRRSNVAASSGA